MSADYYPKRLLDCVVVIGADEHSGLIEIKGRCGEKVYAPQILGVITEQSAIYPYHLLQINPFYPPSQFSKKSTTLQKSINNRSTLLDTQFSSLEENRGESFNQRRLTKSINYLRSNRTSSSEFKVVQRRVSLLTRRTSSKERKQACDERSPALQSKGTSSIKSETIEGLPSLCCPNYLTVSDTYIKEDLRYYVLTNIQGCRLYATAITVSREFEILCNAEGSTTTQLKEIGNYKEQGLDNSAYKTIFIPLTIVCISAAPFYTLMKDLLSTLNKIIRENNSSQIKETIEFFAASLTHIPIVSLPGVTLEIDLFHSSGFVLPAISSLDDESIVDFDLSLLFRVLSIDDIIYLVNTLLLQKRLAIFGSVSSLVTLASETLLLLIQPFKWNFPYIPNLPFSLLELLHAPQPYIMGCHSALLNFVLEDLEVDNNQEVVIVNLDARLVNRLVSIAQPPINCINRLIETMKTVKFDFDIDFALDRCIASVDQQFCRKMFTRANNEIIRTAFYDFIVSIFINVRKYIVHTSSVDQKISFNRQTYLNSMQQQTDGKQFYQEIVDSELFDGLLNDCLIKNNRKWIAAEERLARRASNWQDESLIFLQQTTVADEAAAQILATNITEPNAQQTFSCESLYDAIIMLTASDVARTAYQRQNIKLPAIVDNGEEDGEVNFYTNCLITLEGMLDDECDNYKQAVCLKLKSDIYIALQEPIMSLKELYRLSRVDIKLLDKRNVIEVLQSLNKSDIEHCCREEFFVNLKEIVNFNCHRVIAEDGGGDDDSTTANNNKRVERTFTVPIKPLSELEFNELLKTACITNDRETQELLFKFFTQTNNDELQKCVDHELFRLFYNQWIHYAEEIEESFSSNFQLDEDELILKVSNRFTRIEPAGNGYLIATQERLLFTPGGGKCPQHLCWFSDIIEIKRNNNSAKFMFFKQSSVKTLVINYKRLKLNQGGALDRKQLVLWLNDDCHQWFHLLTEIWSSRIVAKELRDSTMIKKGVDHFLILDTIYACTNVHRFFADNIKLAKSMLTKFTDMKTKNIKLTMSTQKFLRFKFDSHLPVERSIEDLIYLPKKKLSNNRNLPSMLLCCCNYDNRNSKLLAISTDMDYRLVKIVLTLQEKLICMEHCRVSSTVWIGSMNRKIYVVDAEQLELKRELVGHSESVLCIRSVESEEIVLSGSYYGEVIAWKSRKYEPTWKINSQRNLGDVLNMIVLNDLVVCNTHKAVLFYRLTDRSLLHSFQPDVLPSGMMVSSLCQVNGYLVMTANRAGLILMYDISQAESPALIQSMVVNENQPDCQHIKTCNDCVLSATDGKLCANYRSGGNTSVHKSCRGISKLLHVNDYLWICCKDGNIFLFSLQENDVVYVLQGHSDGVQAICWNEDAKCPIVYTGGRIEDGKIAVWNGADHSNMERFEAQLL